MSKKINDQCYPEKNAQIIDFDKNRVIKNNSPNTMKFDDFLMKQLKDPEFKAEYDKLEPKYEIISKIMHGDDDVLKEKPIHIYYLGYYGTVQWSEEYQCYFGKVLNCPETLMVYEGKTLTELEADFRETIDENMDYLKSR